MVETAPPGQRIRLHPGKYCFSGDSTDLRDVSSVFPVAPDPELDQEAWEAWRVAANHWVPQWLPGKGGLLVRAPDVLIEGIEPGVELEYRGGGAEGEALFEVRAEGVGLASMGLKFTRTPGGHEDSFNCICVHSGSAIVRDCTMEGGQVYVEQGSLAVLSRCLSVSAVEHGLSILGSAQLMHCAVRDAQGDGVHVYSSGQYSLTLLS